MPDLIAAASLVIAGGTGLLSMLGSLVIIHSYYAFPDLRSQPRQLLLFLSVSDLGQSLSYVLGFAQMFADTLMCTFFNAFFVFCVDASFFWTSCIAYYIYWKTKYSNITRFETPKYMFTIFHLICWGYPVAYLIVLHSAVPHPIMTDPEIPWCVIRDVDGTDYWRLFSVKAPLLFCWVFTSILYLITHKRIKKLRAPLGTLGATNSSSVEYISDDSSEDTDLSMIMKDVRPPMVVHTSINTKPSGDNFLYKLTLIPLMFLVLRVWGVIFRFVDIAVDASRPRGQPDGQLLSSPGLNWMHLFIAFGDPLQGFVNFMIFIVLTDRYKMRYRKWWAERKRKKNSGNAYYKLSERSNSSSV